MNASTGKHAVKVSNGTSSIKIAGVHNEIDSDLELLEENAAILKGKKNNKVTLEFVNKTPLRIKLNQMDGLKVREELPLSNNEFVLPKERGFYNFLITCDYSNGVVTHFLKVEVK
ncbi:hypothetical protein [Fredinandcohnia sp. 179-A 10B2 NHS]|uniref:hypothetical protein n=1 Tax=Fredinandcohnia sp. 179-A 10B2 NHS TaxID=3235176 RepID=UPI0039A1431E